MRTISEEIYKNLFIHVFFMLNFKVHVFLNTHYMLVTYNIKEILPLVFTALISRTPEHSIQSVNQHWIFFMNCGISLFFCWEIFLFNPPLRFQLSFYLSNKIICFKHIFSYIFKLAIKKWKTCNKSYSFIHFCNNISWPTQQSL